MNFEAAPHIRTGDRSRLPDPVFWANANGGREGLVPPEIIQMAENLADCVDAAFTGYVVRRGWAPGAHGMELFSFYDSDEPGTPKMETRRRFLGSRHKYVVVPDIRFDSGNIEKGHLRFLVSVTDGVISWTISPGILAELNALGVIGAIEEQGHLEYGPLPSGNGDPDIGEVNGVLTMLLGGLALVMGASRSEEAPSGGSEGLPLSGNL